MMRIILWLICFTYSLPQLHAMAPKIKWDDAIDHAVVRYGLNKEPQLIKLFSAAGLSYPPKDITLLAFKREKTIQLWAKNRQTAWKYIRTYPLTASSGHLGPKLKERDGQIPEGIYHITMLNPFSAMHLSLMLDYPNSFDRQQASKDGRRSLGGDIFLHGKSLSVGCLAVGDQAIDQLFLLVARVGIHHAQVIISPNDLRKSKPATNFLAQPRWLPKLYQNISHALNQFPLQKNRSFRRMG